MFDKMPDLISYIKRGDFKAVKSLIESGSNPEVTIPETGHTALQVAFMYDHMDIAEYLLGKGANINAVDRLGSTVLILAAMEGNTNAVKFFLEHGADPTIKNIKGWDAMQYAKSGGFEDIVELLNDKQKQSSS